MKKSMIIAALCCLFSLTAGAQKFALIDMEYILKHIPAYERANGTLTVALSYSSKWELVEATKKIARRVQDGTLQVDDINESTIDESLNTSFLPDPDLLIRTGGEYRLSNFLLWQCAYTELYFCDTYWPDFDEEELCKAIWNYQQRERRFGKTSEQVIGTTEQ